jgi:hypothetical protein
MLLLALDISTKTGFAVFVDGRLTEYGQLRAKVEDFNVNDFPDRSPKYPYNIIDAANSMADQIMELVAKLCPTDIVVENTVKGRNRHTQRCLEFLHFALLTRLRGRKMRYMDPSEWRALLGLRLNKDQKKNNQMVSQGKKRGRITKKHLAINWVNETYGKTFKVKDNDICDSIGLGSAYLLGDKNDRPVE